MTSFGVAMSLTGTSLTGEWAGDVLCAMMSFTGMSFTGTSLTGTSLTGTSLTGMSLTGEPARATSSPGRR